MFLDVAIDYYDNQPIRSVQLLFFGSIMNSLDMSYLKQYFIENESSPNELFTQLPPPRRMLCVQCVRSF